MQMFQTLQELQINIMSVTVKYKLSCKDEPISLPNINLYKLYHLQNLVCTELFTAYHYWESDVKKNSDTNSGTCFFWFWKKLNFKQWLLPSNPASIIMKIFGFMFLSIQSNYDQFLLKTFKKDNSILHFLFNECIHNWWINTWTETYLLIYLQYFNAKCGNTFPLATVSTHSFLVKKTFTTKRLKSFTCHNTLSIISCFRQNIFSVQLGIA